MPGKTATAQTKPQPEKKRGNGRLKMADKTTEHAQVKDVLGTRKPVTAKMIREGLSPMVIQRLSKRLNVSTEGTLKHVNLSKQTYARRQKTGKLTAEESDRVWRVANLISRANQLLDDEDAAAEWLNSPAPALGGETPLERASTELGARDVEQLIGRLEHGIVT